jgi:hypothetical protein
MYGCIAICHTQNVKIPEAYFNRDVRVSQHVKVKQSLYRPVTGQKVGRRTLRLPDFEKIGRDGGQVVSPTQQKCLNPPSQQEIFLVLIYVSD